MPSSIVISSVTAPAYTTPDGVSPTAGIYYPTPGFDIGQPPWFSDKAFQEVEHLVPGIGIGTTRMGDFGPRTCKVDLIFVDTTVALATGRYFTALAVFSAQARYSITCRGQALTGCKIVANSTHFIGQKFQGGKSHVVYGFAFKELG